MFNKKTIRGVPKSEEILDEKVNGYHIFGQNIKYQYPQKVLLDEKYLTKVDENKPILAYTSSTCQIGMIKESFYRTGNNGAFQGLFPKFTNYTYKSLLYILTQLMRYFAEFGYDTGMANVLDLKFSLPTKNGEIDFDFMETFITELEAQRVVELEAYLLVTGLKDYELTKDEKLALEKLNNVKWREYNLESLFGKSTRGKRLKSDDRIEGNLIFVTAGETNEGISAFIGNDVEIFPKNTVTIDMFGSAKYRNYEYGADDHIAVVHTENLSKNVAIFVTSAIHKTSYNGQFNYGRNFYAKDADTLDIMLPIKDNEIDYNFMDNLISAIHKLVIKDVVLYADNRINATKLVIKNR